MDKFDSVLERPQVFLVLDALYARIDNQLYSKESEGIRNDAERLQRVFGCPALTNECVNSMMGEIHLNYLDLAKAYLT